MRRTEILGLSALLLSAFLFAVCPPIAKTMYEVGWSAGAVLFARLVGCTMVILIPTLLALRGSWARVARSWPSIVGYGAVGFVGMTGFFFLAIEHISVTLSQLIQMSAPVMIVFWVWLRTRRRPPVVTFLGVVVALAGLLMLLDPRGSSVNLIGVVLALASAVCSVAYFLISARQQTPVPSTAYIGLSMAAGAIIVAAVGGLGILPLRFSTSEVSFGGADVPWLVPLALIVAFTVAAYLLGIYGLRCIGATVGSFTIFSEVPFAALASWILLAELPDPSMIVAGLLILGGVALVKWGEVLAAR